jgi:type I restriction enzyme S subunit
MSVSTYKIADICSIVRGTYPTMKTPPGDYPLVVTAAFRRSASTYQLEGPAVCVPLISSTGHGDAALHRVHYQEGKFALANLLVALIPRNEEMCDPKYLYHLLMAKKDEYFVPLMFGTANVSLKEQDIAGVEIPLPPLDEQRRIVSRIEELAAKVREARNLRESSLSEAEALVASEANRTVSEAQARGWPEVSLGDVAEIQSGVTLGRRLRGATVRLPYLRVANVQDGHLDLSVIKEVEILATEVQKWRLMPGDVLLTEGGDWDKLGRGTVWRGEIPDCIHQNHIFRVRTSPNQFDPDFVAAIIGSPYGKTYFQTASKQTTNLASINQRQLKAFKLFSPPLEEQRRFIGRLSALHTKMDSLRRFQSETAEELDALMPSILSRAFRGEL